MPKKNINNNDIICKNCTSFGHTYRECPHPVSSFGIICYYVDNNEIFYLMIQRKNTLAFMEFIKGNYNPTNEESIKKLLLGMTLNEKNFFKKNRNFDKIWVDVWSQNDNKNTKEYVESKANFEELSKSLDFNNLIDSCQINYLEPEWGFPKGRRKVRETDMDCSIREFTEETQFSVEEIAIDYERPFQEIFYGSNNILYKHTYYVARFIGDNKIPFMNQECYLQIREIRDIRWFNYIEVLKHIKQTNKERINLFKHINSYIQKQNNI